MHFLFWLVHATLCCLQAKLDTQCAAYTPVATAAASIFFALGDLVALSHMYRFSRAMYMRIFSQALSTSAPSVQVPMRLVAINSVRDPSYTNKLVLACSIFKNICALKSFCTVCVGADCSGSLVQS